MARSHGQVADRSPGAARIRSDSIARFDIAWGTAAFVWGGWAVMLVAALGFVQAFGSRQVPRWDDWSGIVPALTGEQPITARWLWSQHNEHRVPVPRLLLLAVLGLTGNNFRAAMDVNVLALGAVALGMIRAAKKIRGSQSFTDAIFPVVLLNWVQAYNLLCAWQVQMVSSTALAGILLYLIAACPTSLTPGQGLFAGLCLLLLPLCGANGLALVPALALWLAYAGVLTWKVLAPRRIRNGCLLLTLAGAALGLVALYFVGYEDVTGHPPCPGIGSLVRTTLEFLSCGVSPLVVVTWWPSLECGVLGLLTASLGALVRVWWRRPEERLRALGLFLFLGAMGSLAVGLGWGRSGFGEGAAGTSRYFTLAAPVLLAVYLVGALHGGATGRSLQMTLFLLCSATFYPNMNWGLQFARDLRQQVQRFKPVRVPTFQSLAFNEGALAMKFLTRWLRLRQATYRNPWPQPESHHPWLDQSTALSEIGRRRRRGMIDDATAEGLEHWHRYGYLILPGVIDEGRIERVLADFERFWAEQAIIGGHRRPLQKDALGHFQPTINVHMQSDAVKEILLDRTILHWLGLILGRPVYGCQSINFFAGSGRGLHHDHIHMTTRPYGFLAAAWTALEDIDPRSGPLLYVPGSHRLDYLGSDALCSKTGTGQDPHATLAALLAARLDRFGLRPQPFLARRGDVLLWHCNLIHGGAAVEDPGRSRLSMACHYAAFGVEYHHEWSGIARDPSDVLYYKGAPYLPEYYDANGVFAPTLQILRQREAPAAEQPGTRGLGSAGTVHRETSG